MQKASHTNPATPSVYRLAAGVGVFLLIASGAGYQWLAGQYAHASSSVPIPRGTLGQLPMEIDGWKGRDVPISDDIIRATDCDDFVNRAYARPEKRQNVGLWVAYGVKFRDLMPHRPEVCYTGNGWTLDEIRELKLAAADSTAIPCRLLRFTRGALGGERITVLNYYLIDGQCYPDVSGLRKDICKFNSDIQYVAQLQITCSDALFQAAAEQSVTDFAVDSAALIRDLLERAVAAATSEKGSER